MEDRLDNSENENLGLFVKVQDYEQRAAALEHTCQRLTKENEYFGSQCQELQDALNITREEKENAMRNWQEVAERNDKLLGQMALLQKTELTDLQNAVMFEKMAKEKAQADAKESMLNIKNLMDQVGKLQQGE